MSAKDLLSLMIDFLVDISAMILLFANHILTFSICSEGIFGEQGPANQLNSSQLTKRRLKEHPDLKENRRNQI